MATRNDGVKRYSLYDVLDPKFPAGAYRVWLTPHDAEELLKFNTHNRPINRIEVLKWTIEMRENRWRYNGDTIRLDTSGNILDGQTRLLALAKQEAGFELDTLVVTKLPKEVQSTIDQGRKRSVNDQLTLAGIEANKSLAAAVRAYMMWANEWWWSDTHENRARMTAPRIVEWSERHENEVELMRAGQRFTRITGLSPSLTMCAYAIIAQRRGHLVATEYFQRLLDGTNLEEGSPILALRNRLNRCALLSIRIPEREMVGMLINVFNVWQSGKTMMKVQPPKAGYYTELTFPRVK